MSVLLSSCAIKRLIPVSVFLMVRRLQVFPLMANSMSCKFFLFFNRSKRSTSLSPYDNSLLSLLIPFSIF